MRHRIEDVIPSRGPFDFAVFLPLDAERVVDFDLTLGVAAGNAHGFRVLLPDVTALDVIVTLGLDVDLDDASGGRRQVRMTPFQRLFRLVIRDGEFDMIENVIRVLVAEGRTNNARVLLHALFSDVAADGEACRRA